MTPEEKARQKIDQWFAEAGWKVINREDYEPACTAVAIREGLLKGNLEADYFLFINGKAVGVLEAKREDIDALSDKVCEQAVLYAKSVPHIYQAYQKPLPFIFTSNGKELYFCSAHFEYKDTTAHETEMIKRYKEVKYDIYKKSFNAETKQFGPRQLVFKASEMGMSATFPRISPDGRYLLFAMLPVIILFLLMQKQFIAGLTAGAAKG